jgi:hypothetical protein
MVEPFIHSIKAFVNFVKTVRNKLQSIANDVIDYAADDFFDISFSDWRPCNHTENYTPPTGSTAKVSKTKIKLFNV